MKKEAKIRRAYKANPKVMNKQKNDNLEKENVKNKPLKQTIKEKFLRFNNIKNINYYIYAMFIIIAYLFYQLGYSFIYSYYFGGNNYSMRIMDIAINQIPFNMALVSLIGIIVFMLLILYYIPLHMCLTEDKLRKKFILIIPNIAIIYIIFSILVLLNGSQENKQIVNIVILLGVMTSLILVTLLIFKTLIVMAFVSLIDGIVSLLFLIIEMSILGKVIFSFSLKMDKQMMEYDTITYIFIMVIISVFVIMNDYIMTLRKHHNKLLRNISNYIMYLPFFVVLFIDKINLQNTLIILIAPLVLLILGWVAKKILSKIKVSIANKRKHSGTSGKKDKGQGGNSDKKDRGQVKGIQFIIISFMLLLMILVYLFFYNIIGMIGSLLGKQIQLNNPSNITYYTTNSEKSIKGIVVEQTGNTYFISTYPKRELVIINSPYIIVEPNNE